MAVFFVVLFLAGGAASHFDPEQKQYQTDLKLLKKGTTLLMSLYDQEKGGWGDPEQDFWHQAICLRLVLKYMDQTHDFSYWPQIINSFAKLKYNDFENNFNDDMLWWALLWADTYGFMEKFNRKLPPTKTPVKPSEFLGFAKNLFAVQMKQWGQNDFGQGLTWRIDDQEINAIENVLYAFLASYLFEITKTIVYLQASNKAFDFIEKYLINRSNNSLKGLIIDGPINGPIKRKRFMSYTHGIYIEALVSRIAVLKFLDMKFERQKAKEQLARFIENAIACFSERGVLREFEKILDRDQMQFKGIFVLGLMATKSNNNILGFLKRQQKNILILDPNLEKLIPCYWFNIKKQDLNYITHASGLSVFLSLVKTKYF